MPTLKDLLDAGRLEDAVAEATRLVKDAPADSSRRTALFELLCFSGEWDRALKQLDAIGHTHSGLALGVESLKQNVTAEQKRAAAGGRPAFLSPPPQHLQLRVEARLRLKAGDAAAALELLEKAEEERPAHAAEVGGKPVDDFRDYDDVGGGALEFFLRDRWLWIPFEHLKGFEVEEPKKLRDYLWAPARVEMFDGSGGEGFVPTLYAGSALHADPLVRLGRSTETVEAGEGIAETVGMRCFLAGEEALPLFQARTVRFLPAAQAS